LSFRRRKDATENLGILREVIGLKINNVPDKLYNVPLNLENKIYNEFHSCFSNIGPNPVADKSDSMCESTEESDWSISSP